MYIDTGKLPTTYFDLCKLLKPYELVVAMKSLGFESYVYEFKHKNNTMKYGVQYNIIGSCHGERIYRQAFHIPGWPRKPSKKSAGNDMLDILPFFPGINKNDVKITVWDMTHFPRASSINPKFEVNQLERQFIREYTAKFGCLPAGNIKDEKHMDSKSVVTDIQFERLFSYE